MVVFQAVLQTLLHAASCYSTGLPAALELGVWDQSCINTNIGSKCTAACPENYMPGVNGPPTSSCTYDPATGLAWSAPSGSCKKSEQAQHHMCCTAAWLFHGPCWTNDQTTHTNQATHCPNDIIHTVFAVIATCLKASSKKSHASEMQNFAVRYLASSV